MDLRFELLPIKVAMNEVRGFPIFGESGFEDCPLRPVEIRVKKYYDLARGSEHLGSANWLEYLRAFSQSELHMTWSGKMLFRF
jgi:hypothetical protein